MADENLDQLKAQLELQERSLTSEKEKQEIMKAGGIHYKTRQKHAEELLDIQDDILAQQENLVAVEKVLLQLTDQRSSQMKVMGMLGAGLLAGLETAIEMQKKYSDLTKATQASIGLSVNEAKDLNSEIIKQIKGEKMYQTTTEEVVGMMNSLNEAYGGAVKFTAEQAVNMDITAKRLGISTDHAAQFSNLMFLSGESSQEVAMNTLAAAKALAKAEGVHFDTVMKDMAAAGKDMLAYFGGSAAEMSIMAVKARKLGFELSDMKTTSEALLDVEGRIEKQMILNQLTGKNINLDKATALVLEGDMIGAQKEVLAQMGDISQMDIMSRKVASEMLGMDIMKIANAQEIVAQTKETADDRERIKKMEEDIRNGQVEEFGLQLAANELAKTQHDAELTFLQNVEDKAVIRANQATEDVKMAHKLQIIEIAISALMAAQAFSSGLKAATEKKTLGTAIMALPKHIATATADMGKAVGSIWAGMMSMGPFGIPLAIGAIAGLFAAASKAKSFIMNDGVIDPQQGMVVNGPEGSIQLNKKDSIIAGTDLAGGGSSTPATQSPTSTGGIDIEPLLRKMDLLIGAVTKGRVLNVDGYQLNEVLHLERTPSGV